MWNSYDTTYLEAWLYKTNQEYWSHKNMERQTMHMIVSWPNPKQLQMGHTSDLMMMIIRERTCILTINEREWVSLIRTVQYIAQKIIERINLILDTHETKCTWQVF